jgi:hypothetical protein
MLWWNFDIDIKVEERKARWKIIRLSALTRHIHLPVFEVPLSLLKFAFLSEQFLFSTAWYRAWGRG